MAERIKESDWKLLRAKLPGWQESYMQKLLDSYAEIIGTDSAASERFWELDQRIRSDKKSAGVVVYGLSRSNAMMNIFNLLADGVISIDDLEEFSDEAQERARIAMGVIAPGEAVERG